MKQEVSRQVIGSFELVGFPQFGMKGVTAKIDTGAYSGALHCTAIRAVKTPAGEELHFSPFDNPAIEIITTDFAVRRVRSSNGREQKRYFIHTEIVMRGKVYPIMLSLADRSEMKWPVLIGRRFLRHNNFLVDVSIKDAYRRKRKEAVV